MRLTVAITAHDEGIILGPTLKSVEAAITLATSYGFSIQRAMGLDRPTPDTIAFVDKSMSNHWSIIETDYGDPFMLRNELATHHVKTELIAYVDGDDLISENWLLRGIESFINGYKETGSKKLILHPELNVIFEDHQHAYINIPQTSKLFTSYYFYFQNYYDMMSIVPAVAIRENPYQQRDLASGYGFQDWRWNLDTIKSGWIHIVSPNTVIFKRRRSGSVSEINKLRKCIISASDMLKLI